MAYLIFYIDSLTFYRRMEESSLGPYDVIACFCSKWHVHLQFILTSVYWFFIWLVLKSFLFDSTEKVHLVSFISLVNISDKPFEQRQLLTYCCDRLVWWTRVLVEGLHIPAILFDFGFRAFDPCLNYTNSFLWLCFFFQLVDPFLKGICVGLAMRSLVCQFSYRMWRATPGDLSGRIWLTKFYCSGGKTI